MFLAGIHPELICRNTYLFFTLGITEFAVCYCTCCSWWKWNQLAENVCLYMSCVCVLLMCAWRCIKTRACNFTLCSDVTSGNRLEPILQMCVFTVLFKQRCVRKPNFKFSLFLITWTFYSSANQKLSALSIFAHITERLSYLWGCVEIKNSLISFCSLSSFSYFSYSLFGSMTLGS